MKSRFLPSGWSFVSWWQRTQRRQRATMHGASQVFLLGYFWHPEIFPLPHSSTGIHLPHRSASRGKPERCRHKVASPGGLPRHRVTARGLFPVGFNTTDGMKGRTELLLSKRRPTRKLKKNPAFHRLASRKRHSWLQKDQKLAGCQYGIELQSSHLYRLAKNLLV